MSIFDSIEDLFDEDAKFDRAYDEGLADGETSAENDELDLFYRRGYDDGYAGDDDEE